LTQYKIYGQIKLRIDMNTLQIEEDTNIDLSKITKVSMGLTTRDLMNTETLKQRFATRSKAATVSESLAITKTLSDLVMDGGEIYVKNKKGELQKVIIPSV